MYHLGVDPGYTHSAYVMLRPDGSIQRAASDEPLFGRVENMDMLPLLSQFASPRWGRVHLAIEMVSCYGQRVGAEVFDTCRWIGRFQERWGKSCSLIERRKVKQHLGITKGGDAEVAAVLRDRYGPGRQRAVGKKSTPGPLYGITRDVWAALAVALTDLETHNGPICNDRLRSLNTHTGSDT